MMEGFTTGRLLALIRRFTGNLASLQTTAKTNLVAAINEVAASSGGGGGEDYSEVYQNTLSSDTPGFNITGTNLGGGYQDVVLYLNVTNTGQVQSTIPIYFLRESYTQGDPGSKAILFFSISNGSSGSEYTGTLYTISGVQGDGGLALGFYGSSLISSPITSAEIKIYRPLYGNGSPNFPAEGVCGILIGTMLPAGTTITVYARRKVTA